MLYLDRQQLIQKLGITDIQLTRWEDYSFIKPIQDISGEPIYPMSWMTELLELKKLDKLGQLEEEDNISRFRSGFTAWSPDDAGPRLQILMNKMLSEQSVPSALEIWKIYRTFLKEPIRDDYYDRSEDFINTSHWKNRAKLSLIRQFNYYDNSKPEGSQYDHMDQLTIFLEFEPTEENLNTSLLESLTGYTEEEIEEVEKKPDFQLLMSSKLLSYSIEQITQ